MRDQYSSNTSPTQTLRALVYAAVSTDEQADPSKPSLPAQIQAGTQFCENQHIPIVETIVVDGHSRYYMRLDKLMVDCPPYGRMIDLLESGKANLIVAYDYTRLWRTDALRAQVAAIARDCGAHIYSISEPTPIGSDSSFWMELMFGGMSEQENRLRVRRWREGMRGKARRGEPMFTSTRPYGYERAPDGSAQIVPQEAQVVQRIFERRAQGLGYTAIAEELNNDHVPPRSGRRWWSTETRYILNNPLYAGTIRFVEKDGRTTTAQGLHEPIVSHAQYDAAASVSNRMSTLGGTHVPPRLLSGLMRCAVCGQTATYNTTRYTRDDRRYTYARCTQYDITRVPYKGSCKGVSIRMEPLHKQVREELKAYLAARTDSFDVELKRAMEGSDLAQRRMSLISELADVDARLKRWYDALESGELPLQVVAQRSQGLVDRREHIEREVANLNSERDTLADLVRQRRQIADIYLGQIDSLSDDDLRPIVVALVRQVNIHPDHTTTVHFF